MEDNFTDNSKLLTPEQVHFSRLALHLTEKELADAAGITLESIKAYECGNLSVSEDIARKLADVLEIHIENESKNVCCALESEIPLSSAVSSSILDLHKQELIDFLTDHIRLISQFSEDDLYKMESEMEQIINRHEEDSWKFQLCSGAPLLNNCESCKNAHHGKCPAESIEDENVNPCLHIWKEIAEGRQ